MLTLECNRPLSDAFASQDRTLGADKRRAPSTESDWNTAAIACCVEAVAIFPSRPPNLRAIH